MFETIEHHPCWTNSRLHLYERIHLPVAPYCNIKCAFCDRNTGASCHLPKPGRSTCVMSVDEALEITERELAKRSKLRIVAIAGPGEPLANLSTIELIRRLQPRVNELSFCLSTNGVLLKEYASQLANLHVSTVTVSMSTHEPKTAAKLIEWAMIDGKKITGISMGREIIQRQLSGITHAVQHGIHVKVNTILIPRLNGNEIQGLARTIADAGAELQNIVPLVPNSLMATEKPPSSKELAAARQIASSHMRQFMHCAQCRSDVVGIPGRSDTILKRVSDRDSQPQRAC